jgi:3',5'-cyclic AMP phosphodiesterase CpdA
MNISMNTRYKILVVAVCVIAAGVVYTCAKEIVFNDQGSTPQYPVYNGEQLFQDIYPYTFVFFGDNRPAAGKEQPEAFKAMIPMINNENPLFIVGGGDFVIEGTPENFEAFLNVVSDFDAPLFYVCGNHDDSPSYSQYLGERVYALTYQNALFIILDNSKRTLPDDQLTFLEEQLKKGFEHTFVFLHIPPFDPEGTYAMINPEPFLNIIATYNVDYVFSSHIHCFYEESLENTTFIISGGGGAPLYRGGYYHYCVITVGDTITCTVVRL